MPQLYDIFFKIKFYDFQNHKCETRDYKNGFDKLLLIKDNILLFGIFLIDTNTYNIIYNNGKKTANYYAVNYYKLLNGNILIEENEEGKRKKFECKFENNKLIKIKEFDFGKNNNDYIYDILENKKGEIITVNDKSITFWK